jgi:hypothetical protein
MSSSKRASRIKRLQGTLPRGKPLDTSDLTRLGIYPELAYRYVKSGWLERLGRGMFMFAGDQLQQERCLEFLSQRIPGFHVGGKTALAWRGLRHNVAFKEKLCLWGPKQSRLPGWFQERFPSRYTTRELFDANLEPGLGLGHLPGSPDGALVSDPERGLLEMLSEVGVQQGIEEARNIMELASSLRMETLEPLLRACRQVKAIRLCVLWAKELGLPWAEKAAGMVADRIGTSRWVTQLKDGRTLILKPR